MKVALINAQMGIIQGQLCAQYPAQISRTENQVAMVGGQTDYALPCASPEVLEVMAIINGVSYPLGFGVTSNQRNDDPNWTTAQDRWSKQKYDLLTITGADYLRLQWPPEGVGTLVIGWKPQPPMVVADADTLIFPAQKVVLAVAAVVASLTKNIMTEVLHAQAKAELASQPRPRRTEISFGVRR